MKKSIHVFIASTSPDSQDVREKDVRHVIAKERSDCGNLNPHVGTLSAIPLSLVFLGGFSLKECGYLVGKVKKPKKSLIPARTKAYCKTQADNFVDFRSNRAC